MFDALKLATRPKEAGVAPSLAEAQARAVGEALGDTDVATKADIQAVKIELKGELQELRSEVRDVKSDVRVMTMDRLGRRRVVDRHTHAAAHFPAAIATQSSSIDSRLR